MEIKASSFKLRANAPKGQKRFPISKSDFLSAAPGLVLENFQGTAAHSGIPALAIHGPQATMLPSS